jgi:hypothetical protein
MVKFFCMPADFRQETIDEYDKLNKEYKDSKIVETYGNVTIENVLGSGRAIDTLPRVDLMDLRDYVQYSREKNIDFNYTINATQLGNKEFTREGFVQMREFIKNLWEAGVRTLTIALPSIIELVQSLGLDFRIKASTLCQITNVNKALAYKKMGMSRIVVDESINRDFALLKGISEIFNGNVEIIINPLCLKDCTYRMFHYNQISSDSMDVTHDVSVNYYEHRCVLQRHQKISNMLRMCWVRPEDLEYYTSVGIRYFKLQGRQLVFKGDPLRTIKAYLDKDFDGDMFDLINMFYSINHFKIRLDNKKLEGFIKPFYEVPGFCKRDCERCHYCDKFAKKIIDYPEAENMIKTADDFYQEFDKYNKMMETSNKKEKEETTEESIDVDFNL